MELWMAAVLFLIFLVGVFLLLRIYTRNKKRGLMIAAAYLLGATALACLFYIAMTFLGINAVNT